jgi:hypothetical protein
MLAHHGARVSLDQVQNKHGVVSNGCQMLRQVVQSPDGRTVQRVVLGHALQGPLNTHQSCVVRTKESAHRL